MYLKKAGNVMNEGILNYNTLTSRRPLFPIVLASGFKLLGKSVQAASLATRFFFALSIILIYILGRIFYNQTVGLLSVSLVSTSYGINHIAKFIDTDIVLPFFILLFIFIYYISLVSSSYIWAFFAGISLVLALLVKESSLFCLGLPLGMIILAQKEKRWEYAKRGFCIIGTLVILLIVRALLMGPINESFFSRIYMNPEELTWRINIHGGPSSFLTYLLKTGLPKFISQYYHSILQKVTPLSFLMIIGYIFVSIRGLIYKRKSDIILLVLILCALPLIISHGDIRDRLGQTTFVYIFLYITLAVFVVSCISLLMSYLLKSINKYRNSNIFNSVIGKHPILISNILIFLIGFFLIKAQLFDEKYSTWKEWTEPGYSLSIFLKKPFEIYGRYTIEQQEAAKWLNKNVSKQAKMIADGYTNEALNFFEAADYEIPIFYPTRPTFPPYSSIKKRDDKVLPLYFITYSNFDSGSQRNRVIFPIFEENIVTTLKRENPDYLVLSGKALFYKAYFDKVEGAILKFSNRRARIYEIHLERFEPVTFEYIGVNETINEHIDWLEKNHPDEYLLFKEKIEAMGLTIDDLKNSPLRFPKGEVY